MLLDLRRGLVALLALTVLVGIAYPVLVFGIGQAAFRGAANGSLVHSGGRTVGSALIGQSFGTDPSTSGAARPPPATATTPARPAPPTSARPPPSSTRRSGSGWRRCSSPTRAPPRHRY